MCNESTLLVMAGPNGSGKSSITKYYPPIGAYVNADEIERYLGCSPLQAAQIAEATREHLLANGESFTFETVLSTTRNYSLMSRAKDAGYNIVCVFVLTKDPAINVTRVQSRMAQGGNAVPIEKITPRYVRSLTFLPRLFDICNELYVYDNSLENVGGKNIMTYINGELRCFPNDVWSIEMLDMLIHGHYADRFG